MRAVSVSIWLVVLFMASLLPATERVVTVVHHALAAPGAIEKPLVLLRFNQRKVHYERQLFMAISRAVEVKPSVMFELVSVVPAAASADKQSQWQSRAQQHAQDVMASMQEMGVPQSRMHHRSQSMSGIKHDELHIFVR
jgi:hypothetical protein